MTSISAMISAILVLSPNLKPDFATQVAVFTTKYCVSPARDAFIAIMSVESGFDATLVSPQGDFGLAQVNGKAWGSFYKVTPEQLLNPETNIRVGCSILNLAYKRYGATRTDWVGFYHSRHEKARLKYLKKVNLALETIKRSKQCTKSPSKSNQCGLMLTLR